MVAPGTTAPLVSLTVPVIWPVAVCALAVFDSVSRVSKAPSRARFHMCKSSDVGCRGAQDTPALALRPSLAPKQSREYR